MTVANERMVNGIKTRILHGKDYVEVSERVHQVYEQKRVFSIAESAPVQIADRWLWRSVIVVDGQQYIGNAEIKFGAPKNTPDGTNPFECAETSAIGRALAFAGFGSVESIASKDEVMRGQPYTIEPLPDGVESGNAPKPLPPASQNGQAAEKPSEKAIHDMVGRAKLRAAKLGLVHNASEWSGLLDHLQIKEVKTVADIGKINEFLSEKEAAVK